MFQKDPQILMAHPDQGIEKFEDLKKLTLFISQGRAGELLPVAQGRFRLQRSAGQALYLQSAAVPRRQDAARCKAMRPPSLSRSRSRPVSRPRSSSIADQGFNGYSTLIETRRDLVEKRPDMVQRFVDASIIGWYNYHLW